MKRTAQKPGQYFLFGLIVITAIILADQYTKWLVMETMLRVKSDMPDFAEWFMTQRPLEYFEDQRENYNTVTLAPFLNFVMVWNEGVSFGLFDQGGQLGRLALIGLSLLISFIMIIWLAVARRLRVAAGLALVVGGAVGNVIDRIRFNAVADFVDVHVAGYHWPAFNVADSAIVIGAAILILDSLLTEEKSVVF